LPIIQGKESTGANSIAVYNAYTGMAETDDRGGGDFTADSSYQKIVFY
jgi:hypothetical protein